MARYGHLDAGSPSGAAPKAELCADSFGTLVHSPQTPVPLPAGLQDPFIHTAPIIADHQPELPVRILQFDFNAFCTRVAKSIDHGFAADAIELIPEHGMQGL